MLLDQPGDQFGVGDVESEPRAEPPCHLGAGDRVVLGAALGDVVQQRGDVDQSARCSGRILRIRSLATVNSSLPPRSISCRKPTQQQQMLVDRVMMGTC